LELHLLQRRSVKRLQTPSFLEVQCHGSSGVVGQQVILSKAKNLAPHLALDPSLRSG
jgi:hypothetical protein